MLTAVLTPPEAVRAVESVEIEATTCDDEILLVQWPNALVYEMATRGSALSSTPPKVPASPGRSHGSSRSYASRDEFGAAILADP